ncbi:MAG: hypothetical protein Q8O82_08535 [Pseudorhodobacter sp.]|nr:hypothetical protein [Pseudorhodobacter sp.]
MRGIFALAHSLHAVILVAYSNDIASISLHYKRPQSDGAYTKTKQLSKGNQALNIHETRSVTRFGQPFTLVMVESIADDVAVYELKGHHTAEEVAAHGFKWTEREAALAGFKIPAGKYYRR